MFVITKTFLDNNGKPRTKVLTGRTALGAEFVLGEHAVNVREFKTRTGALSALRSYGADFVRLHEADGAKLDVRVNGGGL